MKRRRKSKRQKKRRIQAYIARTVFVLILLALFSLIFFGGRKVFTIVRSAVSGPVVSGNSIKISKSGALEETVVEDFDSKTYSEKELRELIDQSIADYNEDAAEKDEVRLSKLTVKKGQATLVMVYSSVDVYSEFNSVPVKLTETDDGKKLTLNMDITVITPSKIKDSSKDVELLDSKIALFSESDKDSYIVF